MELNLSGASAYVTGGGSGIGRAACVALAAEGARVAVVDLNLEAAQATADSIVVGGGQAIALQADVTVEASVQKSVEEAASAFEAIDLLILCAGISGAYGKAIDEIPVAQWDGIFDVNVKGQWLPTRSALPYLRNSDRASVTIVASDSSLVASPRHVPYCASKGGTLMLTKALAVDLREDNIRVNCVCPSIVNTPQPQQDLGLSDDWAAAADYPVQDPDDIARYLVFLASPVSRGINGHPLVADFGYLAQSGFPT